jgi:hypothetical protein
MMGKSKVADTIINIPYQHYHGNGYNSTHSANSKGKGVPLHAMEAHGGEEV